MNANDSNNISRTDWAALEAMTDEEIDYSDIPPLTEAFFENATLRIPAAQAGNIVRLEPDIVNWFRSQDSEYKSLINRVLRQYIETNGDRSVS